LGAAATTGGGEAFGISTLFSLSATALTILVMELTIPVMEPTTAGSRTIGAATTGRTKLATVTASVGTIRALRARTT
jgi:hypothetical protein